MGKPGPKTNGGKEVVRLNAVRHGVLSLLSNREKVEVVVSERKLRANRRNAKLSTGPRDTGNSKYNALKHGLLSKAAIIRRGEAKEDPLELTALVDALRKDFEPVGTMEEILLDRIAACYWRLRRVQRAEVGEIRGAADSAADETTRRAAERSQYAHDESPRLKGMLEDARERIVQQGFLTQGQFTELAGVHGLDAGVMASWLFDLATLPLDAPESYVDSCMFGTSCHACSCSLVQVYIPPLGMSRRARVF